MQAIDSDVKCVQSLVYLSTVVEASTNNDKDEDLRTLKRCRWFAEMASEDEETALWPGEVIQLNMLGNKYPAEEELFRACSSYLMEMVDWESVSLDQEFLATLRNIQQTFSSTGVETSSPSTLGESIPDLA